MEIKESELKTFDKKERIKEEKALRNQQEFGDKLMEETENLEDQERLLLYLENKEVSLMEQLKNTQFLQKKAYEDFVINN